MLVHSIRNALSELIRLGAEQLSRNAHAAIDMKPGVFLSEIMLITLLFFTATGAAETGSEKTIASFVLNFIKFTAWPELPAVAGINLCVAARPALLSALNAHSGKMVTGHPLRVIDLGKPDRQGCQALFIEKTAAPWCDCRCLEASPHLLTISDRPEFIGRCGIIGLYEESGQLHFEINLNNAERAGVRLSAQLLRLSRFKRESAR